ncbi:MAG TPA: tRNA/rRNA methyltransferase [Tenuifilaceae bacterium]|nr:tRNA/rRNA methyltransferase [Tenuifilaceae bacterium]HPE18798.1 tRNA/rRNA methyltransferase [Tenuifilaceae bacterium]HPJ45997.1 tRNA/rRNA methyltransferase [Tenuifilaceae bacterium]HPQ34377.1 tRNA/rRNA methyltransferase [Tenuifilaceae bacterium]HRX68537.1 tRNA/rRNA methyltransferase [Tenuifilaceae bacterium]
MDICFVLVEPAVPENVGAAARAIKTMGFKDLRLVKPCEYQGVKALMLAHGSHDILENAKVYDSLEDTLVDIDFAVATTAKQRWVKQNVIPIDELKSFLMEKEESVLKVAIVFGREESGLTNDEISLCDRSATVPLNEPFPSLNLAQAVMVFAFSLANQKLLKTSEKKNATENRGYKPLKKRIVKILNQIGIPKTNLVHGRILERLSETSDEDVNLLHSVSAKLEEKLGE